MITYPRFLKGSLKITDNITACRLLAADTCPLGVKSTYYCVSGQVEEAGLGTLKAVTDSMIFILPVGVDVETHTLSGGEWLTIPGGTFFVTTSSDSSLSGLVTDGISAFVLKNNCVGNFTQDVTFCVPWDSKNITIYKFITGGNK